MKKKKSKNIKRNYFEGGGDIDVSALQDMEDNAQDVQGIEQPSWMQNAQRATENTAQIINQLFVPREKTLSDLHRQVINGYNLGGAMQIAATASKQVSQAIGMSTDIKDKRKEVENDIVDNTMQPTTSSSTDELLNQWSAWNPMKHVGWRDLTNKGSVGSYFADALTMGGEGAMAGSSLGGIGAGIGAAAGATVGILGNLFAGITARKTAKKLNNKIDASNLSVQRNFANQATTLDDANVSDQLSNWSGWGTGISSAAFGGPLHTFAGGGFLSTNGADFDNGYTIVKNGGTHEENPNEGVQMGIDSQGIKNLVEKDEFIMNDYVFSNRLNVPKEVRKKYKISPNKPITFAKFMTKASKEAEERPNDPISKRGLDATYQELMAEQEKIRALKQLKEQAKQQAGLAALMQQQGMVDNPMMGMQEDSIGEAPMEGEEEYPEEGMFAKGGKMGRLYAYGDSLNLSNPLEFEEAYGYASTPNISTEEPKDTTEIVEAPKDTENLATPNSTPLNLTEIALPIAPASYSKSIYSPWKSERTGKEYSGKKDYATYKEDLKKTLKKDEDFNEVLLKDFNAKDKLGAGLWDQDYEDKLFLYNNIQKPLNEATQRANDRIDREMKAYTPTYARPQNKDNALARNLTRYAGVAQRFGQAITDALGLTNHPDYTLGRRIRQANNQIGNISTSSAGQLLDYRPTDMWAGINNLNAQFAAQRAAIRNAGNRVGSTGNLLASAYNQNNALGNYLAGLEDNNWRRLTAAAQHNTGIKQADRNAFLQAAQFNAEQGNRRAANMIAAAQADDNEQTNYTAARAANRDALVSDISSIGREQLDRDMIAALAQSGLMGTLNQQLLDAYFRNYGANLKAAEGGKLKRKNKKKGLTYYG